MVSAVFHSPLDAAAEATAAARAAAPVAAKPVAPAEPATVKLTALVKDGNLALDGTATQRPLQPVTLSARLPLDLPALLENPQNAKSLPLSAQVKMPASSLAFLPAWVPALRSVAGTAAMDFTFSGTVGAPVWKGGAIVSASEVTFGTLVLVKDLDQGIVLANAWAPEHLSLVVKNEKPD